MKQKCLKKIALFNLKKKSLNYLGGGEGEEEGGNTEKEKHKLILRKSNLKFASENIPTQETILSS